MRFVTLSLLILTAPACWADFLAYSVSDDGKKPLPENIDAIEAKYLLNIEWGEFVGAKSRLGVLEVDNTSGAGSYTISTGGTNVRPAPPRPDRAEAKGRKPMNRPHLHQTRPPIAAISLRFPPP